MRVVFLGTPHLSVATLRTLVEQGHDVPLVVTQPDRRRGRGALLAPSPVKAAALDLGLPVSHRVKDALGIDADVAVLVAFGRLIKRPILDRYTIINLHPSLLPRWRGATPVEGAILGGDTRTGICLMKLEEEMDAGPIYARAETDIGEREKAAELYERLFATGNELLAEVLREGLPSPAPQEGEPTFCGKLGPEDFHINWDGPATRIDRLSRIGKPWTTFRGKRFLILDAVASETNTDASPGTLEGTTVATGDGALELLRVQPEGKGPQEAKAWANGARLQPGDRVG